jgi:hypothetical protein
MKKSSIHPMPLFFERYIHNLEDMDLMDGLKNTLSLFDPELEQLNRVADKRYALGKWTPKDILQHIIDNERIQAYRALRIARNDKTVLPGYDEELLARNANAAYKTIADLVEEFKMVRQSNIMLFKSMTDEVLLRTGICYQVEISVLALGFVLVGHQIHHMQVLRERYYSL